MKLARAAVNQGLTRIEPNFQGAALGNPQQLRQVLLHFRQRIKDLETVTGGATIDLQKPGRKISAPPYATLTATKTAAGAVLQITNPQFLTNRKNTIATPVYHHIEMSDDQQFAKNVTSLPVTTQTHILVPDAKAYVRFRSSLDGTNKNSPQFVQVK